MSGIVCATRGGEGSRAVQEAAIQRAKAEARPLIFLYVADTHSLDKDVVKELQTAVLAELTWMGETLLRMAQRRADAAQLPSEVRIRQGHVRQEIGRFLMENDVSLLMLGAPRGTTANVFGDDAIEQFAETIQKETHIPVNIVRPDQS